MEKNKDSNELTKNYISFDDEEKFIEIKSSGEKIPYHNISGYQYIEERGSMGKGALARAFSGSFLGDSHHVFVATKMQIEILLKVGNSRKRYINMLITPIKSNNMIYRNLKRCAEDIISKLQRVQPLNCKEAALDLEYVAELRELKQLVEDGVITQEDYLAKKKQILGI